jgi:hypothetical protein
MEVDDLLDADEVGDVASIFRRAPSGAPDCQLQGDDLGI